MEEVNWFFSCHGNSDSWLSSEGVLYEIYRYMHVLWSKIYNLPALEVLELLGTPVVTLVDLIGGTTLAQGVLVIALGGTQTPGEDTGTREGTDIVLKVLVIH